MKVEFTQEQANFIKKVITGYIKSHKLSNKDLSVAVSILEKISEAESCEFLHECGVKVITPF